MSEGLSKANHNTQDVALYSHNYPLITATNWLWQGASGRIITNINIDSKPCPNKSWANQVDAAKSMNSSAFDTQTSYEVSMPSSAHIHLPQLKPISSVIFYDSNQPANLLATDFTPKVRLT